MPAVRQFDVLGKRIPERSDILSEYQREPLFLLLADIGIGIRNPMIDPIHTSFHQPANRGALPASVTDQPAAPLYAAKKKYNQYAGCNRQKETQKSQRAFLCFIFIPEGIAWIINVIQG